MRACLETQKSNSRAAWTRLPTGLPMRGQALRARGPAPMKPSAFRIERLLAKGEAEVVPPPRARRYAFHPDEVGEAEAQGLPYALVPRVLSKQEWLERYATPEAEAEFYARFSGGPVAFTSPGQPVAPAAPKPSAPGPQQVKPRPP